MLLLSVNNFTWKRNEDMELFISVYMTGGSTAEQRAPRYGVKKNVAQILIMTSMVCVICIEVVKYRVFLRAYPRYVPGTYTASMLERFTLYQYGITIYISQVHKVLNGLTGCI
jgi:hypothetical protein